MKLQALSLGLYVHIPFCTHACAYCHFFKQQFTPQRLQQFLEKIRQESVFWKKQLGDRWPDTIFWGGGSPSCLPPDVLWELGQLCRFPQPPQEWTVEVSPASITREKLAVLAQLGVTRLSMGVQSFQASILRQLGRKSTSEEAHRAYALLRECGFKNINLDLIFSPQFTSWELWENDLTQALRLAPEHISTYCLTYESETGPFTPEKHRAVDEDKEASFYEKTWVFLEKQGYQHYEVSNFAKPGYACLHNLHTWQMQEWIGWGPSAASQYQMKRFQNLPSLEKWVLGHYEHVVNLSAEELCKDCLIFGLRMRQGVDLNALQQRFPTVPLERYNALWRRFEAAGWVTLNQHRLACTPQGLLLADSLALEIL